MRTSSFLRLFLTAMLSVLALSHVAQAAPIDRIVAVVNDEVITYSDLRDRVALSVAQMRKQNVRPPNVADLERQILDRMVTEKVQLREAKATNILVDDSTLTRALQSIASNNKLTLDQLRSAVEKQEGIPWSRFREDIRTEITLNRLRERDVDNKVTVSDAEVDAFLKAQAQSSLQGREFLISQIFLTVPENPTPAQVSAIQKRIAEIRNQLQRGESFTKVAEAFSDASGVLKKGPSLGWLSAEALPAALADKIASMKAGEITDLIRSQTGVHIFKLEQIRNGAAQKKVEKATQTRARHILVRTSDVVSSETAQRRLIALREQAEKGTDFAMLARNNSADTGSAAKGGDLGWVSEGDTVPEFEKAMNALKPGQISEPIQTPFGWHIIQVLERREVDVTNNVLRAQAQEALRKRKSDEVYDDWLRQLRDSAYIELRLDQK